MSKKIHVLDKRLALKQADGGLQTSTDSVFLAAACPAKSGERILDLGCGVGSAGLCVLMRVPDTKLTGVDIQSDHIELAKANALQNGLGERTDFHVQNIKEFKSDVFNHVICNPPYMNSTRFKPSPNEGKSRAIFHDHDGATLQDWLDCAHRNLKSGGTFTIIHRADQTDKIILGLKRRYGAVEIIPLWPKSGQEAKRVIIRAIKDRNSPAKVHAGIVLHEENGTYTGHAETILRSMQPLL